MESRHLETQKVMGMLVKDIMQCFPNETGELLHVVEFIVYNTPGPHGYTPRDIDRRWSMATPLDKELQPFMVNQFEPISDYLKTLFRNYREIRVRVLGWLKDSSAKRADLANRFRRLKNIQPGDEVVVRDRVSARLEGGHRIGNLTLTRLSSLRFMAINVLCALAMVHG